MLHFESRQGGKKDSGALIAPILALFLLFLMGCHETATYEKRVLSSDAFNDLKDKEYALNPQLIRRSLEHLCEADHETGFAVTNVKNYYRNGGSLVWVSYAAMDFRADTLLSTLQRRLPEMGFDEKAFNLALISSDMERMRNLHFDEANQINHVVARLEYYLMKAYMCYVTGQRFGFVNPTYVLNHCDVSEKDSTGRALSYRPLYDVQIEHPDEGFFAKSMRMLASDNFGGFLHEVEPKGAFYHRLASMLPTASASQRQKILVNMERQRWREKLKPDTTGKYIVVNVPAFHLWAVSPDTLIDMRVACGATRTKTPLLSSRISHMEVNPEWVIPISIIRDDVARHGGDSSYFAHHRYYIADRRTGKHISPKSVSPAMLMSGNYRVAQYGGAGNSLGRIIFRFPNNFSVFLHDTSSPGAFGRDNRGVSHGCVRVQRPFDLALFMMEKDVDEWLVDRLRISMGMKPETDQGRELLDELDPGEETPRLIRSLPVSPRVPIFIIYNTIFQTPDGSLKEYPDVYGYDEVIGGALKPYI